MAGLNPSISNREDAGLAVLVACCAQALTTSSITMQVKITTISVINHIEISLPPLELRRVLGVQAYKHKYVICPRSRTGNAQ